MAGIWKIFLLHRQASLKEPPSQQWNTSFKSLSLCLPCWCDHRCRKRQKTKKMEGFLVHEMVVPEVEILLGILVVSPSCFLLLSAVNWGKMPKKNYKGWLTKTQQSVCEYKEDISQLPLALQLPRSQLSDLNAWFYLSSCIICVCLPVLCW